MIYTWMVRCRCGYQRNGRANTIKNANLAIQDQRARHPDTGGHEMGSLISTYEAVVQHGYVQVDETRTVTGDVFALLPAEARIQERTL